MASPNETIRASLDDLQKAYDEVVVQTTQAIRDSGRDPSGGGTAASPSLAARLESHTNDYQMALDEIEREITRAMAVTRRDLRELRERRMAPPVTAPVTAPITAPVTAAKPKPVAPPAPMSIDSDSPAAKTPSASGPAAAASQSHRSGAARPSKPESRPPAPLPDMGFDLTVSPEVRPSPSPALSQTKAKQVKPSPKTSPNPTVSQTVAMTGRPASAPPKKEAKVGPQSQASRTAGSTPQAPAHAPSVPVAPPAPMTEDPMSLPFPGPPSTATAPPARTQNPAPQHEIFTNMAFSVAPAANEPTYGGAQMQMQQPTQQQHAADNNMLSMTQFGAPADMAGNFDMASFDTGMMDLTSGVANNNSIGDNLLGNDNSNNAPVGMADIDADIEKLFRSNVPDSADKMDVDYGLGDFELDNSSFDIGGEDYGGNVDFGPDLYPSDL